MKLDQTLLDEILAQAKGDPRLRQSYDLRNPSTSSGQVQSNDNSWRMLNAMEPGGKVTEGTINNNREYFS